MKLSINLSADEAAAVLAALRFVKKNCSFNPDSFRWQFRNGGYFDCNPSDFVALGTITDAINEAREEESNRVHFAGCCYVF